MSGWEDATNVLAVRLDTLGDVLMMTPALRALKQSRPGRRITLLTSAAGAEVARLVPEIDRVLVYEAPWMKSSASRADSRHERLIARRLRKGRFDAAIIFTTYSQSPLPAAFLCHFADIPLRLAHCRENPYQLLTHWVPEAEPERTIRHEVRRQLDLVATTGCTAEDQRLSLKVPPDARRGAWEALARLDLNHARPWIVLHAGATAPSRRYPPESFAEAARCLARDAGIQIVITGSAAECELVEGIRHMIGDDASSLAGQLTLSELAALLEMAPLLLSNNSGPVHVAAAVGTPVVDLYALTNPQHTPWGVPCRVLSHDVPCKYCHKSMCPEGHHNCLRLISPQAVSDAVLELLAEQSQSVKNTVPATTFAVAAPAPTLSILPV